MSTNKLSNENQILKVELQKLSENSKLETTKLRNEVIQLRKMIDQGK